MRLRLSEPSRATLDGLVTCGSVWACPVCSAKVNARRSLEVGALLLAHENAGGRVAMLTLTVRHDRADRLADEIDGLQASWNLLRGNVWQRWHDRLRMVGHVRVLEVTYGRNGWHAHVHVALLVGGHVDDEALEAFRAWVVGKWARSVARQGFEALPVGQDLHLVDGVQAAAQMSDYLTKAANLPSSVAIGLELFGAQRKIARRSLSTVPAWALLSDFVATGDLDSLRRWREFEQATFGRRQMLWSRGVRELYGLGDELADETLAGDDLAPAEVSAVLFDARGWSVIQSADWSPVLMLEVLEREGWLGLELFLRRERVPYSFVREVG